MRRTLDPTLRARAQHAVGGVLILLSGCAHLGEATAFDPGELEVQGWLAARNVPLVLQKETEDCGAAALQMVLTFWQVPASEKELADSCPSLPGQGIRARDLRDMARKQGLHSYLIHATWEDLKTEVSLSHPLIVGLVKPTAGGGLTHYEVVVAVHPEKRIVVTQDPAKAWRQYPWEGFRKEWEPAGFLTLVFSREDSRPGPPSPGP